MNDEAQNEASAGPVFPESRELKRPYFILRARGGEKPFYASELQGILRDPKEPFSAYLPAAEMDNPGKPGKVTFQLPEGVDPSTLSRMESLPQSTIEAFQKAAESFQEAEGLDPFRKQIRNALLLPDPDEEPDAWWVYGPPEDRRLLVIWGCEFQRGTSLPPLPDPKKPNSPSILDRLQARVMDWPDYQRQMRDLLLGGRDPLSRFIAKPELTRKGEYKSLVHLGKRLDWDKTKPLKTVGSGEIQNFHQAAGDFYQKAHPDTQGVSEYEKELRTHFRLPDLEKQPELFRVSGGKLIIAVPDALDRAETRALREDDELNIPEPEAGEGGAEVLPETTYDQLLPHATPWMARGIAAGVVLILLIGAAVLFELFADRTPPGVDRIVSENTPEQVLVQFNEAVNPNTLQFAEEVSDEEVARGKANTPAFQITSNDGKRIEILTIEPVKENAAQVQLSTQPMEEGAYTLTVHGVRDTSRKKNRVESPTEYAFQVMDTLPPSLEQVSADNADGKALLLFFSEPVDRSTASLRTNYTIRGVSLVRAQVLEEPNTVRLLASDNFEKDQPYTLEVLNMQDASSSRNPINEPLTFTFTYRDTIPPTVESVAAPQSQVKVFVTFSEKVTPESAQTPANYQITVEGASGPEVVSANLYDDGTTVALTTEPLYNGVDYGLSVQNIQDQGLGGTLNRADPILFNFTGQEDREPPAIEKVTVRFQQNFWVTFTEPVKIDSLLKAERWSFSDPDLQLEGDPEPSSADGKRVKFKTTGRALNQAYTLSIEGEVEDLVGNVADGLTSPEFSGVNIDIIPTNTLRITGITPAEGNNSLVVQFNEAVVREELETEANYLLSQGIQVQRATVDPTDPTKVFLSLDGTLSSGTSYRLTLRNLRTQRAPSIRVANLSERFTAP